MKRTSSVEPGYNCGPGGRDCQHEKKGDHGISGGTWWYAVSTGPHAASLSMLARDYPESVKPVPPMLLERSLGSLGFHKADPHGCACALVEGGRCEVDMTWLGATEFWDTYGDWTQAEQPEAFWLALEQELLDYFS